jgi:hypothetical protein
MRVGSTAARLTVAVAFALIASTFAPPAEAAGPYGPDTCLWGYVWREARPTDHVCVTPAIRSETRTDNSLAASRRSPTGGTWGPDTCLQGYVWREAFPGDHVCVPPATRSQAAADNAQASRRLAMDAFTLEFLSFPNPADCVWGGVGALSLNPDGSFSMRGVLSNDDATVGGGGLGDTCRPGHQVTVICAVPLVDHSALWFTYSVWLPSHTLYGVPQHVFNQSGTSAKVVDNWTKIPQRFWYDGSPMGPDAMCGKADSMPLAQVKAYLIDHLGITGQEIIVT